ILELLSVKNMKMSELVQPLKSRYFISGEINIQVKDPKELLSRAQKAFSDGEVTLLDGVSVEYPEWRFNLRPSQTEPLVRLNVEAKGEELLKEKTSELLKFLKQE
ncbi:MAG: phosphomannomutase, partial [bacterium]